MDCAYWIILAVLIGAGIIKRPRGEDKSLPPPPEGGA